MTEYSAARAEKFASYVPGEQNRGRDYVRLNTNEALFSPPASVIEAVSRAAKTLNYYSDPQAVILKQAFADKNGLSFEQICASNGSDEALDFIFGAFADTEKPLIFPDITYTFYENIALFYNIPYKKIQLDDNFLVQPERYFDRNANIVIANPNAQTGLAITNNDIAAICDSNRKYLVIIDEAYAEFEGISAIPLLASHKNLIVVRTFSKSRFLAGARIGFAAAAPELIRELETVRNSRNPYNVNAAAIAAGTAALGEEVYYREKWSEINKTREYFKQGLRSRGYYVSDSAANFVLCRHPEKEGAELYEYLKENGFLVRKMSGRIEAYLRISIGTRNNMESLLKLM